MSCLGPVANAALHATVAAQWESLTKKGEELPLEGLLLSKNVLGTGRKHPTERDNGFLPCCRYLDILSPERLWQRLHPDVPRR